MADLHTATVIADVDLTDTVEFPVRLSATSGLLRGTFAKLKTYLKAALKMTDFSDVDISTPPTNGQALVWNSTSSKFKPGSVSSSGGGGSGGAIVPLATVTLGAAAASINFAGIDQTYDDLIIVLTGAGDTAATFTEVRATFNADSGANYDYEFTSVNNATASSSGNVGQAYGLLGWVPAASGVANAASTVELTIPKYAGTSFLKNWFSRAGLRTGTAAANMFKADIWGDWRSTAAITQVTIVPQAGNFATGTKATVYGRKAAVGTGISAGNGRWAPPRTHLNLAADYNPTDNTWVALPFTTEVVDEKNAHDNVTNPERITVPSGVSRVRLVGHVSWTGGTTLNRYIAFAKNGNTSAAIIQESVAAVNAWEAGMTISSPWIDVVAGDYFSILVNDGNSGQSVMAAASGGGVTTNKGTFFYVEFDDGTCGLSNASPTVIQSKSAIGATGAVTLDAAPTAGNLLVAVGTHWTSNAAVNAGWTQLVSTNGSTDGTIIATKVVTADDTATVTPWGNYNSSCVTIHEVKDWNGAVFLPFNYKQETAGTAVTVNFGVPTNGSLLVGHAATLSANTAPTSITGAGTVGTTVQGTTTSASPRQATPFYTANLSKGNYAITVNYAASASQYISGVVIVPR